MTKRASEVTLKVEEVIVGPSDHLPLFGKYMGLRTSLQQENWHYGPAFKKGSFLFPSATLCFTAHYIFHILT